MYGREAILSKLASNISTKWFVILYLVFGGVAFAHLCLFIQYPFAPEVSVFTAVGEKLKSILPVVLLVTLIPVVHKTIDKITNTKAINIAGLVFIVLCVGYQIAGVSGQAWSTVAFSGALILLLYNHTLAKYDMSKTVALVFSFMVVWLGWVVFEALYQTGLWFKQPIAFGHISENYYRVMLLMFQWMTPALLYIFIVAQDKAIVPKIKLDNIKYSVALLGVCAIATGVWYSRGMLIPVPLDGNGVPYALEISYLTREHLEFSLSRLSQISVMIAVTVLFFRRRQSSESVGHRRLWLSG